MSVGMQNNQSAFLQGILAFIMIEIINLFFISLFIVLSIRLGITLKWIIGFQVIYYLLAIYLLFFKWHNKLPKFKLWILILIFIMFFIPRDFFYYYSPEELITFRESEEIRNHLDVISYLFKVVTFILVTIRCRIWNITKP